MDPLVSSLQSAWSIVEEAALPEHVQASALVKVLEVQLGGGSSTTRNTGDATQPPAGEGDSLDRVAGRVGVSRESAELVFDASESTLQLVLPASRLDNAKAKAAQQIALLVVAGRQALGLDDAGWTSIDDVREAVEYFGRYDKSNFASSIRAVGESYSLNVRGGGRAKIELRMTAPAWEHAKVLVKSIAGTEIA
jgi:hypothetical protein